MTPTETTGITPEWRRNLGNLPAPAATMPTEEVRKLVDCCYPEHLTDQGRRLLREACDALEDEAADEPARAAVPRAFVLVRDEDATGVSGTGVVAQGVEFADGTVALRWLSAWPTSVVFHDRGMEGVEAVHGHGGRTRIVYADG